MVNMHALAGPIISSINPTVIATILVSAGSTTNADGSRTPAYDGPIEVPAQVQSLTFHDLHQVDGLNLNGTKRAIYLYGRFDGVVRPAMKGGDLITLTDGPNAGVWLVAMVGEQWPDWVKCLVTLQNDAP